MSFGICSLASSSSGNCYLLKTDSTALILDCGISVKKIKENLALKGVDIKNIAAVLITHEHIDHVKSLKTVLKKAENAEVYMSEGTYKGIREKYNEIYTELLLRGASQKVFTAKPGVAFTVGDITVNPFKVSHDTNDPIAYSFLASGKRISVVTDTGYVTDEIYTAIKDSDVLIIESNHEPEILLYGRYPYQVKQRILSDYGHLSNEACGECLAKMIKEFGGKKVPVVYLAHLSEENNTPEQALLTVKNYLEEENLFVGKDLYLDTLKKDQASRMIYAK